jgi:hypothetical protein
MTEAATTNRRRGGRPAYRSALGPARSLMLRLPEKLHRPIKILAAARGLSLNDLLVQLIEESFGHVPDRAVYERLAVQAAGVEADQGSASASPTAEPPARRRPRGR